MRLLSAWTLWPLIALLYFCMTVRSAAQQHQISYSSDIRHAASERSEKIGLTGWAPFASCRLFRNWRLGYLILPDSVNSSGLLFDGFEFLVSAFRFHLQAPIYALKLRERGTKKYLKGPQRSRFKGKNLMKTAWFDLPVFWPQVPDFGSFCL